MTLVLLPIHLSNSCFCLLVEEIPQADLLERFYFRNTGGAPAAHYMRIMVAHPSTAI